MAWDIFGRLFGNRSSGAPILSAAAPDSERVILDPPTAHNDFEDGSRDGLRGRIADFEAGLQGLTQLPEQFRLLLPAIETSLSSTAFLRGKVEAVENTLAQEQSRLSNVMLDLSMAKSDLERVEFALKREEVAHARQRERSVEFEVALADVKRENTELLTKVTRLEPLHRESTMQRDALQIELEKLKAEKKHVEDVSLDNARELQLMREQIAKEADIVNNLRQVNLKATERLEEAQNEIFDRDNTLASLNEKLAAAVSTLTRERGVIRSLRADNEQLLKDREENKSQFESQLEAARGRYRLVERLLEESRARFQAETQQLSLTKREKSQRDHDLSQISTALEAARSELSELRAASITGAETLASVNAQLMGESEKRRRLELEIDMLREENNKLSATQKSISTVSLNQQMALQETSKELQARIAALRSENAQLRVELNSLRYDEPLQDVRKAGIDAQPKDEDGTPRVVPMNR